jgi:DNA repair protein RadB
MDYLKLKCLPLDNLLGGGIESGTITEVCGEAGSGKTNLCLQATRECASEIGKIAFIDSEGISFKRLEQMCKNGYNYKEILKKILFFCPNSFENQEKIINDILKRDDIKLIVVDTLNIFYRIDLEADKEAAMRSFLRQMANLQIKSREKDIFVLVSEQVYTDKNGEIKPFTHRETEHMIKTSLKLEKIEIGKRRATIMKHRSQPEAKQAIFSIVSDGLK